jgi:hypothetical protein
MPKKSSDRPKPASNIPPLTQNGVAKPAIGNQDDDWSSKGCEEKMEEKQKSDYLVTLKSGTKLDARQVGTWLVFFHDFLERQEEKFQALHQLATGQLSFPPSQFIDAFRGLQLLNQDNTLKQEIIEIFKSSFRQTPDGSCFVDPFKPASEEEKNTLKKMEADNWRKIIELRRIIRPYSDDDSISRDRS